MNNICSRCNWEIVALSLSDEQKNEILELLTQGLNLLAIQKVREEMQLSLIQAKGIFQHLNSEYGCCIRCNFKNLTKENMECPKCKAFNYNLRT